MSRVAYYLFVYPLSKLPLWFTYRFSDFFFLLLITVFPYRKKVIEGNISRSFPNLSIQEQKRIKRSFYRHFADMLLEGVKNLGISEKELRKRFVINNPEMMQELYNQNKSVLLVSAHYMNWEWMITGQDLFFPHKAVGIGMPLTSGYWDKKINTLRSRFGMHVIHAKNVKDAFNSYLEKGIPTATLTLSDQSPADSLKCYWMTFLHQQTGVLFGAEQLANTYNQAVVFYLPKKIKRGYYEVELQLLTAEPRSLAWGEITETHARLLEQRIMTEPGPWLWSHKRWKRSVPDNIPKLKEEQREKFNRHFRSNTNL
ncbi:lysophospholipid acyltransferase family protein [Fluviicola taffensis]|uniref:Lipid A biosynthesis acyltransferase n=1 Tax=Fluviicola taffensis (strain DSM 16823 / NCIMB 13979 / RW262) TaxID=755732 RepID=F2IBM8_FLUTR|nr:lysophospholipid acyltransferase family protein [Fluviicola taffensis]AEA45354.1 lipid A biosynthesis acyltransferase [Fluviicola taffensis DSM 16823]